MRLFFSVLVVLNAFTSFALADETIEKVVFIHRPDMRYNSVNAALKKYAGETLAIVQAIENSLPKKKFLLRESKTLGYRQKDNTIIVAYQSFSYKPGDVMIEFNVESTENSLSGTVHRKEGLARTHKDVTEGIEVIAKQWATYRAGEMGPVDINITHDMEKGIMTFDATW